MDKLQVQLNKYKPAPNYNISAPIWKLILWYFIGSQLFTSRLLPFSKLKIFLLKLFGAKLGKGIYIKPGIRIKFPWKLEVGDYSWLGEDIWIDNLAPIIIGNHVCISQGVYLCTGNHDWSSQTFELIIDEIHIESYSWLAAKSVVAPGVKIAEGAILGLGSVASQPLLPWTIYRGNPAIATGKRNIKLTSDNDPR